MSVLRLGTRGSALAMAQSRQVAEALRVATGRQVELVEVVTAGDRSSAPVHRLGVGVFVSALRDALEAKEIDFAVHSYKDLPTAGHPGLRIAAVPPREDPRDALVARDGRTLAELPPGATVGTGALRRIAQLHALGLQLAVTPIRGNVDTRIGRVLGPDADLDAVVLARAGIAPRREHVVQLALVIQPGTDTALALLTVALRAVGQVEVLPAGQRLGRARDHDRRRDSGLPREGQLPRPGPARPGPVPPSRPGHGSGPG